MNIFRNLFKRESLDIDDGLRIPNDGKEQAEKESKAVTGVNIAGKRVEANYANCLQVGAFFRVLDLRSRTFSRAELIVEKNVGGVWVPEVSDVVGARDIRHLNYLFQLHPNRFMSACEMFRQLQWIRDLEGCSGIYLPGGWKVAHEAFPVHIVNWNPYNNTFDVQSDHLQMVYSNVDCEELVLLRGIPSKSKLLGDSLFHKARKVLGISLTADQFSLDSLSKGGTQKMFVSEDSSVSQMDGIDSLNSTEVKSAVEDIRNQVANNSDIVFVQGDLKTDVRSQSFQDLQVDLHKTRATEDLARLGGVPLPLMFSSTNAVYKSVDDAFHTFIELTIAPMWREVEQELGRIVLGEQYFGQLRFRFDYTSLCLDSDASKVNSAVNRVNSGITTVNEERKRLGLLPISGGDKTKGGE